MSLVIRFTRTGRRGERKYRVVVKEKRNKRDGKAVEFLGSYEKRVNGETKKLNTERIQYWVSQGAQMTPGVRAVVEAK